MSGKPRKRDWSVVTDYIKANIHRRIFSTEIYRLVGMSGNWYFKVKFREVFGMTVRQYVIKLKLEHAKYLLENSKLSVLEISMECGWESVATFAKNFRKSTFSPPGTYRRRLKASGRVSQGIVQTH